jgi:hypothetical protein
MYCFIMALTVSPIILVKCPDWRVIWGQTAVLLTNNTQPFARNPKNAFVKFYKTLPVNGIKFFSFRLNCP